MKDEGKNLVVGTASALAGLGLGALLASKPVKAATDTEKLDYLIELSAAHLQLLNGQLTELNSLMRDIREIEGLEFAFDPLRYIAWKLRSGEARADRGSYYVLVGPAASFTGTFVNPSGDVWIGISEGVKVSQNGVFTVVRTTDGAALPWMTVPGLCDGEVHWNQVLPFGFVIRDTATVTYTNNDAAAQWLSASFFGIYLRKDVWERDSKIMDLAATKYSQPPKVNEVSNE